ncbi:MAG TPA: biopolymer transporter ExbD [Blastocatellia bacterium]|nr:biopolymer transporter ExbD [Blastocatellia bacterium]
MLEASIPRPKSAPPSINVTPLIDVLLVLLIIFMVMTPRREQKLPVKSPAPSRSQVAAPETLMLTLSPEMRLELNSKAVTREELGPLLSDLMEQRTVEHRTLLITAPSRIPYEPVVALIDRAKGSGVVTIGLIRQEI